MSNPTGLPSDVDTSPKLLYSTTSASSTGTYSFRLSEPIFSTITSSGAVAAYYPAYAIIQLGGSNSNYYPTATISSLPSSDCEGASEVTYPYTSGVPATSIYNSSAAVYECLLQPNTTYSVTVSDSSSAPYILTIYQIISGKAVTGPTSTTSTTSTTTTSTTTTSSKSTTSTTKTTTTIASCTRVSCDSGTDCSKCEGTTICSCA